MGVKTKEKRGKLSECMCIIWYRDTEEYPLDTHIVHTNTYTHIFIWMFISKMLNKHSSEVAGENYLRKKEINKIFLFSKNNIYLFVCFDFREYQNFFKIIWLSQQTPKLGYLVRGNDHSSQHLQCV